MRKKVKKILCFLIIMFSFISDICYEDVKADFELPNASAKTSEAYIAKEETITPDADVCTSEMLGIYENIGIRQLTVPFTGPKRDRIITLDYLCQGDFFFNDKISNISSLDSSAGYKPEDEFIINYLHKCDGKKRIA